MKRNLINLVACLALALPSLFPVQSLAQSQPSKTIAGIEDRVVVRTAERAERSARARAHRRVERKATQRAQQKAATSVVRREQDHAAGLVRQYRQRSTSQDQRITLHNRLRSEFGLEFVRRQERDVLTRKGEILGINLSAASLDVASGLGFVRIHRRSLGSLAITIDVFSLPSETGLAEGLTILNHADEDGHYELNTIFDPTQALGATPLTEELASHKVYGNGAFTVGIIDTGINVEHPSLEHSLIDQQNFGRNDMSVARDHGTAVASILAKYGQPLLKAADVFSGEAGYSDAEGIVRALDWMAQENVGVINMSLAGPDNFLVNLAVRNLLSRGHIIVAAVGNEGPEGSAQYPAAYPDVIGVTAVNQAGEIYQQANRGSYVDVSAHGVDIDAASLTGFEAYSGTSFAVPVISAWLAPQLMHPDLQSATDAWIALQRDAQDLGSPGFDATFGHGLLTHGADAVSAPNQTFDEKS